MDPGAAIMDADRLTAPRACGDGPMRAKTWYYVQVCSPRLRGWTHHAPGHVAVGHLLPAPAGMDPRRWHLAGVHVPAPRACGDGPQISLVEERYSDCSPRLRGWTRLPREEGAQRLLLPAPAGMDPRRIIAITKTPAAPRACGDGWTHGHTGQREVVQLLPAPADSRRDRVPSAGARRTSQGRVRGVP